ncbi:hypothetical protein GF412_01370 [Candidatus Micrarchaeota archaeon]|nr:hypothetical protein [Candidatus Micrarchaeota archaeon]MBD3417621.1 hypothetical protein [Candidatus Micrarchaeota archaeon]
MSRGREIVNRMEEPAPNGRHQAGRAIPKSSTGRHGRALGADISEEPHEEGRAMRSLRAVGRLAKKAGRGATAMFLAAGVGMLVVACSECEGSKGQDAGPDASADVDTDTDSDTDTGTDTGSSEGPECGVYEGKDHESLLGLDEKELLGPVGHWMKLVNMSFSEQIAEVVFLNENWENVNFEGEVVEEGDLSSYFVFDLADTHSLTVSMGGLEQQITLCGVYQLESGDLIAHLITDNEDGFMHCEYVDNGSLSPPEEYEFSETIIQRVYVQSHVHGFLPDIQTGEDHECPGTVSDFVFELTEFDPYISPAFATVPGEYPNEMEMRSTTQNFIDIGQDSEAHHVRFSKYADYGVLEEPFDSLSCAGLTVTWTENTFEGFPLFSYEYPGADYISEEVISAEERKAYVWIGSTIKEFVLRHPEPSLIISAENQELALSIFSGIQELRDGDQVEIAGQPYDVELHIVSQRIAGFKLRPAEVEED